MRRQRGERPDREDRAKSHNRVSARAPTGRRRAWRRSFFLTALAERRSRPRSTSYGSWGSNWRCPTSFRRGCLPACRLPRPRPTDAPTPAPVLDQCPEGWRVEGVSVNGERIYSSRLGKRLSSMHEVQNYLKVSAPTWPCPPPPPPPARAFGSPSANLTHYIPLAGGARRGAVLEGRAAVAPNARALRQHLQELGRRALGRRRHPRGTDLLPDGRGVCRPWPVRLAHCPVSAPATGRRSTARGLPCPSPRRPWCAPAPLSIN